jgi:hypothetical protein
MMFIGLNCSEVLNDHLAIWAVALVHNSSHALLALARARDAAPGSSRSPCCLLLGLVQDTARVSGDFMSVSENVMPALAAQWKPAPSCRPTADRALVAQPLVHVGNQVGQPFLSIVR